MRPEQLAQLRKEEKRIAWEEHKEKMREKDVWERHGFENDFGSKIINAYMYVGASLVLFGIVLVPVAIALALITFLVDSVYPVEFPYNLFYQLPVGAFVIWGVWRFLEEK